MLLGTGIQSLSLKRPMIVFSSLKRPVPEQDFEIRQVIEEAKKTHWSVSISTL